MKKKLFLGVMLFGIMVSMTGCGGSSTKKLTCTKTATEDGTKMEEKYIISYDKDNYVTKSVESMTFEVSETAEEEMDEFFKLLTETGKEFDGIDGIKYSAEKVGKNKIVAEMSIDYNKADAEKLKDLLDITDTKITLDQFKENNYIDSEYTCK